MKNTPIISDALTGKQAWLVSAIVLVFPLATLLQPRAATLSLLLLALHGVLLTLARNGVRTPLSRDEKLLLFSAAFFVGVAVLSYLFGDVNFLGFRKFGRYLRFILLVPIYLVVRRMPQSEGTWWTGLAMGAFAAGVYALGVLFTSNGLSLYEIRPLGIDSAVMFGNLSLVMAFMSLGGLSYFRRQAPWLVALPVAGFLSGLTAVYLSGARVAWLAVPPLAVLLFWHLARVRSWRTRAVLAAGLLASAIVAYAVPETGVAERLDLLFEDLRLVIAGKQTLGAIGIRVELWQVAWDAFLRNPVLGAGVGGYSEVLREWVEAGLSVPDLLYFDHPQNEYLSALASRGIVGLVALLLMFGIPMRHFAWGVRHSDREIAGLSYSGLALIMGFMIYGMTDAIFERTMPITFYVFCLAVIYGLVRANERQFLAGKFKRDCTLSVIVITLNEADRIRACLDSVHGWADEIIVLDSGSTDDTVKIVHEYTDKTWVTDWPGFGRQKQRALEHAVGDWVLSIDADERVTPELRAEIDHTLRGKAQHNGYDVHRPVVLFGRIMDFSGSGQSPLRLFKRSEGAFTQVPVHERVELRTGSLGRLRGALYHETYRDYNHAVVKFAEYAWLQAKARYEKGKRSTLLLATIRGVLNFIHNYFIRLGFLDGSRGFILAALHANYTFNKYAALWEIELRESHSRSVVPHADVSVQAGKPQDGD